MIMVYLPDNRGRTLLKVSSLFKECVYLSLVVPEAFQVGRSIEVIDLREADKSLFIVPYVVNGS